MKTIIEMAREAGAVDITCNGWTSWVGTQSTEFLERFAELVRAEAQAEDREACAKVVDAIEAQCIADDVDDPPLAHVAAAIRAKGNT